MKKAGHILVSIVMVFTMANCSEDGGGNKNKGGTVATAPDRGDCRYDVNTRRHVHSDGRVCDYNQYYNGNACYNFYFQPHSDFTRTHPHYSGGQWDQYGGYYTDQNGRRVDCSLEYLDMQNYLPYNFYHPGQGQYLSGCHHWGSGFVQVPMGPNAYVCGYYYGQSSYSIYNTYSPYYGYGYNPGSYYGGGYSSGNGWSNFGKAVGLGLLFWGIHEAFN